MVEIVEKSEEVLANISDVAVTTVVKVAEKAPLISDVSMGLMGFILLVFAFTFVSKNK